MSEEDATQARWKHFLLNRFVLVPAVLVAVTVVWNLWVVTHDHGIVTGRVLNASGAPVDGAEVKLWVFNFTTFAVKSSTVTKPDGSFAFSDNPSHNIQISAEKAGEGRSERVPLRLYFKSQDVRMTQPLTLVAGG